MLLSCATAFLTFADMAAVFRAVRKLQDGKVIPRDDKMSEVLVSDTPTLRDKPQALAHHKQSSNHLGKAYRAPSKLLNAVTPVRGNERSRNPHLERWNLAWQHV